MKRTQQDTTQAQADLRDAAAVALKRLAEAAGALDPASAPARNLREAIEAVERVLRLAASVDTRYRSLLDAVPDAVTLHDMQGRILDANKTAARNFGHSHEELCTMSVYDLNPDLPPEHMDTLRLTMQLGRTMTVDTTNIRGDGTRFPVEVHSNTFLDGNHLRIVAIARDITRRQRAEHALRSSEERYRLLLDTIDQGIVVQDGSGRIVSANPVAERYLEASEAELAEGALEHEERGLIDEHGHPLAWQELPGPRALRSGKLVGAMMVGIYSNAQKQHCWYKVTAVPLFVEGLDTPYQVFSIFSDVTELKRQSELFRQTQALASIGGWEHHFCSDTALWTEEVYRLVEAEPGPVSWTRMQSLFSGLDSERLRHAIGDLRAGGQPFDLELRLSTGSGQKRWVRLLGRAIMHRGVAEGVSGTIQDITLRKVQEEQLRRQTLTDPLTGLANRNALLRALTRAVDDAMSGDGPALLYIDLDRFKVINDLLGHAAGDGLLVAAAQRLQDAAGPDALVARFGGDEFMLMLPRSDGGAEPDAAAERVTGAFSRPFEYAGEEFAITASVGVAHFPEDGSTIQQLIHHADAAMYDAKRRGRNKWQRFSPQLARQLTDKLLVETQLRRALDNNEFYLHYQPQVDLVTGRTVAAEALLRWKSRMLGELNSDLFIAHAENTGDIVRIGAWVIRQALRQMRAWRDAGFALPRIAVNVSYRQFLSESLPQIVAAALEEFGLPGEALELEMTERVLIEDVPDTLKTFEELKRLGVQLVIDDFGEGYSALSYLRRLPFDGLKISHTFMRDIPGHSSNAALCEAIIDIAQSLGLIVIAEGVENEQQREFLLRQGLTLAQGYLFSKALAPEEFAEYAQAFHPAPAPAP